MKRHGLATALLMTVSVLGLAACNMGGDQQGARVSSARAQADREAVAHVQQELQQLGYYRAPIDGVWGTDSRAAMATFQRDHQLAQTGQPDQASLNALASAASSSTTAAAPPPSNAPPSNVPPTASAPPPAAGSPAIPSIAQVQQELQQLGYYHGRVDGVWGPGTRSAMAAFQRNRGLPVTGQGDMNSMNALGAAAANTGASGNASNPTGTYR